MPKACERASEFDLTPQHTLQRGIAQIPRQATYLQHAGK